MTKIEQAQDYAHRAHDSIGQKRKYSGKPYWVHTDDVASIVAGIPWSPHDAKSIHEDMICAAHLHDVIEDVFPKNPVFNISDIYKVFGSWVGDMVIDLTDVYTREAYPDLNRDARHELENKRLAIVPPASKTIKLADLISNTSSIVAEDKDFARVYIREKMKVLPLLADGSPVLLQRASMQVVAACATLGLTTNLN